MTPIPAAAPGASCVNAAATSGSPHHEGREQDEGPGAGEAGERDRGAAQGGQQPGGEPACALRGQPAGPQHTDDRPGARDEPAADHRRPRRDEHLGGPGQQSAPQHGDRGVRPRDRRDDRPGVGAEPPAEPSHRPAGPEDDHDDDTAVGSSGSTLRGWPCRVSGIWWAASQSGIAAANAPSTDSPAPPVRITAAAAGTSSA